MAKITMAEVFARKAEEIRAQVAEQAAWEATPEGAAWRAAFEAEQRRLREAEERYALEHPEPDEDEDGEDEDDEQEDE